MYVVGIRPAPRPAVDVLLVVRIGRVHRSALVLDEKDVPPVAHALAVNQVDERVAVGRRERRCAAELGERRAEVDVLDDVIVDDAGRHARADDDERHVDVRVERRLFAGHEHVLAHVVAVVGAEDDVRVLVEPARGEPGHEIANHPVDGLDRLDPEVEEVIQRL